MTVIDFVLFDQVEEQGDERVVKLTRNEQLALLAHRTSEMLQANRLHLINVAVFHELYVRSYTYSICFKDLGVNNLEELMALFPRVVEVGRNIKLSTLWEFEKIIW